MRQSNPIPYLQHMRDAANELITYMGKHSFEEFIESEWDQAAAIRNLEIIGEAATNIPLDYRQKYPFILWRDIIDFRNVAIHDYMEVDTNIVWDIIQRDVPILLKQIADILNDEIGV